LAWTNHFVDEADGLAVRTEGDGAGQSGEKATAERPAARSAVSWRTLRRRAYDRQIVSTHRARRELARVTLMVLALVLGGACDKPAPSPAPGEPVVDVEAPPAPSAEQPADAQQASSDASSPDLPGAGARQYGMTSLTDACLARADALQAQVDRLPTDCADDGDCIVVHGVGCLSYPCGLAAARGGDLSKLVPDNEALRRECGPCRDEVVSCRGGRVARCVDGTCSF
jgi:hypothetical protein